MDLLAVFIFNHHTRSPMYVGQQLQAQGITHRLITDPTDWYKKRDLNRYKGIGENFRRVLRYESGTEWKFLLYDDMKIPEDMVPRIEHILKTGNPKYPVAFYVPNQKAMRDALEKGHHVFASAASFWLPAVALPSEWCKGAEAWIEEHVQMGPYAEDGIIQRYNSHNDSLCYTVTPGLFQHDGYAHSTFGIPAKAGKYYRVCYEYDPGLDVFAIDWEAQFKNPYTDGKKNHESQYLSL